MILVLGSINIDLTAVAKEIPRVGETVLGMSFNKYPGGKGANQAVCAAKLKAGVTFLGMVGNDDSGDFMLNKMEECGVDISRIERSETPTGTAVISVDSKGQNSIIVIPGANFSLNHNYIEKNADAIENCGIILAQHETPVDITEHAFEIAKRHNKTTILNPAPAGEISEKLLSLTDILIPNEHELSRITGMPCKALEEMTKAGKVLINKGAKNIIVTLGANGAMLFDKDTERHFPALKVKAIDTTAAGDSFVGGFAAMYSETLDMPLSIDYGQKVASYSVQYSGAQSSMPEYDQFEVYLKQIHK